MRTIMTSYVLLLLCASGCSFLDDLDRSIEQKAEQLTKDVAAPAATSPTPTPTPTPPTAPVPEPPPAEPEVPPTAREVPATSRGLALITLGKIDVRGSLPEKDVRKIIERHRNELRFCYEQTLAGDAVVAIKFIVSPAGAVQVASVERSDSGIEKLDMCLAQAVRRWSFPAPKGGGIVVVTVEIDLSRKPVERK
jgi:TonB family protein